MTRLERFKQLCEQNMMYQKSARKLSEAEFDECVQFIEDTADYDKHLYAHTLNRWKMDKPGLRTRHHTDMWALLMAVKDAQ